MPARELQAQLNELREQLEQNPPLSEEEREQLHELMRQIEAKLELEAASPDNDLVDSVNLAVETFEVNHPSLTGILRRLAVSLHSMGI
ncbi:DUF4404 family protein [Pseudomonas sp. BBP2017]|uniref:DUF4404 family protein n=1 Tax=Pseudomonas sp. BBP2017 TaxID=2109731 RepID=UPI000D130184|nr:DUF4404 family protein [Pseudomonas sp. BBP2017]PSS59125.1 DUF4404 domain-containing protein [Pseudomonas sp. BBP2017]